MPYREQWVADILRDRSIVETALDVHMTTTGAMEREIEHQRQDILALSEVVRTWRNKCICDFDDAALALVKAALKEANR